MNDDPKLMHTADHEAQEGGSEEITDHGKLNATKDHGDSNETTDHHRAPLDELKAGQCFGRYRILRRLGVGAMGLVYLAEDTELARKVALKIPQTSGKDSLLFERFRREARSAARIRHPNICPVYDVGQIDGVRYLTMAFIEGEPLRVHTAEGVLRTPREAAKIIHKLSLALGVAHDAGVIHRDLKPANVMVASDGEPVITDFGLARYIAQQDDEIQLTNAGAILGTPAYMSPEQVEGKQDQISFATDVFSLGVMLYQLLTGDLPFTGSVARVMASIVSVEPEPPSSIRRDIDRRLDLICKRAMAKNVEQRYSSAHEMAGDLAAYLGDEGDGKRQPETVPAPRAGSSRPKWAPLAVTASLSVVAIWYGATTWVGLGPLEIGADHNSSQERVTTTSNSLGNTSTVLSQTTSEVPERVELAHLPSAATVETSLSAEPVLQANDLRLDFEIHVQRKEQRSDYSILNQNDLPLRDGDKLQLRIGTNKPLYVYLYWYDSHGQPARLWPENLQEQVPIQGEFFSPPLASASELQRWHQLGGDPGMEMAVAACSSQPLSADQLAMFDGVKVSIPPLERELLRLSPESKGRQERALTGVVASKKGRLLSANRQFVQLLDESFDHYIGLAFPHGDRAPK